MDQNLYFQRGIQIITKLNEITPQAYLIGGVVRDYLLKVPFNDIDIATSATPEQVLQLFPNAIQEFADYGCITIKEDDMIFEITTFREEVYNKKSRKPSEIHYSRKLLDDINRRDFTINALAMPKSMVLVDLVGGERDIKNKVIRVIGVPKNRFKEDPLRILRGLSLMAKFNFSIERKTLKGMIKRRKNLNEIANVKLTAEFVNILTQPYGKKTIKLMIKKQLFKQVNNYHHWLTLIYKKYDKLSIMEKFIILCKLNPSVLENSCFNKETTTKIKEIIEISKTIENNLITEYEVYKYPLNDLISADLINSILIKNYPLQTKKIKELSENKVINQRSDIVVNPQVIIEFAGGKTGSFVNDIMIQLEKDITTKRINNNLNETTTKIKELLITYDVIKEEKTKNEIKEVEEKERNQIEEKIINSNNDLINQNVLEENETKDEIQMNEIDDLLKSITPTLEELNQEQNIIYHEQDTNNENNSLQENNINNENAQNNKMTQSEDDLSELLKEYNKEFNLMLDKKMLLEIDESMSLNEINQIKEDLKSSARLLTIKSNPKFAILLEKGLI